MRTGFANANSDRFDDVSFSTSGIRVKLCGSVGEVTSVTALRPVARTDTDDSNASAEWSIEVKQVTFTSTTATAVFGGSE